MSALPGTPRLRANARARAGETVEVRILLDHPMDSGRRRDGSAAPRHMLSDLRLLLDGREVARLACGDGASPNPLPKTPAGGSAPAPHPAGGRAHIPITIDPPESMVR